MPTSQFILPSPVGTVSFITIGAFEQKRERLEVATRSNVKGAALVRSQKVPRERYYDAVKDVTANDPASLKAIVDGFQQWPGLTGTYYDDLGMGHTVTIVAVEIPPRFLNDDNPCKLGANSGGLVGPNATHLLMVRITLVDADTT